MLRPLLFAFFTFADMSCASASWDYYLCIGEKRIEAEAKCGYFDALAPCHTNPQNWAARACTIHGSPNPPRYSVAGPLSDIGGNECGYALFRVTCYPSFLQRLFPRMSRVPERK